MPFSINTNIGALNAHRNLSRVDEQRNTSLARLSTGLRINKAADDASGLAIADGFRAQSLGIGQAIQNSTDATSLVQIADGALEESTNILNTIRTKAVQASSDGQTTETRRLIQNDIDRLLSQLNNIANTTSFNGQKLLSGAFSNKTFQVGADANQTVSVSIGSAESTRVGHISTADLDVTSAGGGDVQLEITSSITGQKLNLNSISVQSNNKAENGVGAVAAEINRHTAATGISATAVVSTTGAAAITGGTTGSSFTINGVTIGALTVQNNDADGTLVKGINAKIAETGVTASTTDDGKLVLTSNDGRAIQVSGDLGTAGGSTAAELSTFGHLHLVQNGVSNFQISGVGAKATGSSFTLNGTTTTVQDSILAAGSLIKSGSILAQGSVLGADVELITNGITANTDAVLKAGSVLRTASNLVKGTQISGTVVIGNTNNETLIQDAALTAGSTLKTATILGKGTVVTTAFDGRGVSQAANEHYGVGTTLSEAVTLQSNLTLTRDLTLKYNASGLDDSVIITGSTLASGSVLGLDTSLVAPTTLSGDLTLKSGSLLGVNSDLLTGSTIAADATVAALGGTGDITTNTNTQVKGRSSLLAASVLSEDSTLGGALTTLVGATTLAHDQLLKTGSVLATASVLKAGTKLDQDFIAASGSTFTANTVLIGDLTLSTTPATLTGDLTLKAGSVLTTLGVLAENTEKVATVGLDKTKLSRLSDVNVLTAEGAQTAISIADAALKDVANTRSSLGAVQNQLSSTVANLSVTLTNVNAAESGIRDVDFASEAGNFSRIQVLSQAGSFALSQANAASQSVLSLLQR